MDVPSQDVPLEGTVVVDAPWGRARFSPRHGCFVRVLAVPAPIALHPPGPRVLASSSTWVAIEDTIGVTAAALFATVGVDAVDVGLRRRIWQVATTGHHLAPRTDQIWLGFDGSVVITVPPVTGRDRHSDDDDGRGLLALALDVDPTDRAREERDRAGSDQEDRRALAALLAAALPTEARAFDSARARGHLAGPPVATTTVPSTLSTTPTATATATPTTRASATSSVEAAAARLRALPERPLSIPPTGFIALPTVIDGDDDRAWQGWRSSSTPPARPTSADLAVLNDPDRLRRVAAAFGQVMQALAGAPGFVSVGTPFDVRLIVDGCDFHDDQKRRAAAPGSDDSRTAPFHFRYVPPEQAVGASVDIRASLYVVGVHLYEALAGRHPYWSESAVGFAFQHARKAPPPLVELNPGVHAGLAAVALRLLQKKAADRYAHPGDVVVALARAVEQGC